MYSRLFKFFLILFLSYQTPLYSKSISFDNFNSKDLSNYFSGIVAHENKKNLEALKFFNLSKSLIGDELPIIRLEFKGRIDIILFMI